MVDLIQNSTEETRQHTRIEYDLAKLASVFGLKFHIARNDRNELCDGNSFKGLSGYSDNLSHATTNKNTIKTIELIDEIWSKLENIKYAFEIENTTNIRDGIGRLTDLLKSNPDTLIIPIIVYPDERKSDVLKELERPRHCDILDKIKLLSYSKLKYETEKVNSYLKMIDPKLFMEYLLDSYKTMAKPEDSGISVEPPGVTETPKPIVVDIPITTQTDKEIYEKIGYDTILQLGNEWEYYVNPKWCKIYKKIWKRKKNPPLFHYEFFKLNNKDNIVNVEFHIEGDIKYTFNNELKNKDIKYISKNRNIYKTTDIDLAPKEMSKFIKETYIYFDEVFNIIKTNKDNNRHKYIDLFINYLKEIDYKTNIDIRYECDLYLKVENLEKGIDLYIIIYKYKRIACVLHNVSNNLKQRLIEERENIKKEFGIDLTPRKERENIFETFLEGVDMTDISKFKEYQEWHIETLKILKNIFNKYSKENDT